MGQLSGGVWGREGTLCEGVEPWVAGKQRKSTNGATCQEHTAAKALSGSGPVRQGREPARALEDLEVVLPELCSQVQCGRLCAASFFSLGERNRISYGQREQVPTEREVTKQRPNRAGDGQAMQRQASEKHKNTILAKFGSLVLSPLIVKPPK